jgi:hypothetical protein
MAEKTAAIQAAAAAQAALHSAVNVAQKGVYIVVNAHKGGGIQPERSSERANEHGNQRWLTGEGRSWSHPVVRSQRIRSRHVISRHVRGVTGRADCCAASRRERRLSSSAISRSWMETMRSARSRSRSKSAR